MKMMKRFWMKVNRQMLGLMFVCCFFVFLVMSMVGGIRGYYEFFDFLTLLCMIVFTWVVLVLSGTGKDLRNGFLTVFSQKSDYPRMVLEKSCNAVKFTRMLVFLEAAVIALICMTDILHRAEPSHIGPILSTAFLSFLYAALCAVLLTILSGKLESMLIAYMEESEGEKTMEEAQKVYFKLRALGLTDREAEVARLVSREMTNREIGQMLYISDTTVKKHITHILDKTALADREELTKMIQEI